MSQACFDIVIMKRVQLVSILIAAGFCLNSCATIWHGTQQEIAIKTNQPEAQVLVDNLYHGKGNQVVKLARDEDHIIEVVPVKGPARTTKLERSLSLALLYNLLIPVGSTVGAIIDFISGACYEFDSEQVEVNFE